MLNENELNQVDLITCGWKHNPSRQGLIQAVEKHVNHALFWNQYQNLDKQNIINHIWQTRYTPGERLQEQLHFVRTTIVDWLGNYDNRHTDMLTAYRTDLEIDLINAAGHLIDCQAKPVFIMLRQCGTQFADRLDHSNFQYYISGGGRSSKGQVIIKFDLQNFTSEVVHDTTLKTVDKVTA